MIIIIYILIIINNNFQIFCDKFNSYIVRFKSWFYTTDKNVLDNIWKHLLLCFQMITNILCSLI